MSGLEFFSVYKRTELIKDMIENKTNIMEEIENGSKLLIVRDAVPYGKVGVDIILDNGEIHQGVIDIHAHRELLRKSSIRLYREALDAIADYYGLITLMESLDDPLVMNIMEEIESGSKILIVRDAVPVGKIGIDIILDNGEIHKGVIDIRTHRELLITLMESLDDPLVVTE